MFQFLSNPWMVIGGLLSTGWKTVFPVTHLVWHILNSNFSAALFGALAGALSARYIAKRVEHRQRLCDEISGVNNAIALAVSITNTFVAMKRQHIMSMAKMYEATFQEYVALLQNPPAQPMEFEFITDFRALAMPLTCIVELRQTILDKVKSSVAAISISVPLHQSIESLRGVLALRERSFERLRMLPPAQRIIAYFGLRTPEGHIDTSFSDALSAIISYVDDGIYFPILLCEILTAHAQKLAKEYGKNAPQVKTINYQEIAGAAFLPDRANYPDFEKTYRSPLPTEQMSFWQRVFARWKI